MAKMERYTLAEFNEQFPDEDAALDWLRHKLYPEKIYCPNCGQPRKFHRITTRKVYGCDYCGYQLSPTAGTIFHKSRTPLRIWLYVVFQMAQTRGGISAKQIERETGVTYKTAWRMCNEIRKRLGENLSLFSGDVEVDESYFGGKRTGGKRGRGAENKTPVVGMVERKGRIKAVAVPDTKRKTVTPLIENQVQKGATVHTDEYPVYTNLAAKGYQHRKIVHSANVYVMGNVHTNTIEGFWSLVKNGIVGVFHHVSDKYLQCYLDDEYTFRYNHRNDQTPMFLIMLDHVLADA